MTAIPPIPAAGAPPPNDPPPQRPPEPDVDECCGEGCVPCVFDRYEEAMDRYKQALAAWRERHPGVDPGA